MYGQCAVDWGVRSCMPEGGEDDEVDETRGCAVRDDGLKREDARRWGHHERYGGFEAERRDERRSS